MTETRKPRLTVIPKLRDLPARKSWAAHSVALRAIRDSVGTGGVDRSLWEKTA